MMPGQARRMTWKGGQHMNQAFNLSSFGEEMLVHENAVVKIDDDIPLDRAAQVRDGMMTEIGAVFNAAKMEPGATVAVIGCGGPPADRLPGGMGSAGSASRPARTAGSGAQETARPRSPRTGGLVTWPGLAQMT